RAAAWREAAEEGDRELLRGVDVHEDVGVPVRIEVGAPGPAPERVRADLVECVDQARVGRGLEDGRLPAGAGDAEAPGEANGERREDRRRKEPLLSLVHESPLTCIENTGPAAKPRQVFHAPEERRKVRSRRYRRCREVAVVSYGAQPVGRFVDLVGDMAVVD